MDKFRLDIEPPAGGWAIVRLTAPGVELTIDASCTPCDSIGDLARAAAELATGAPEQVVVWNTEPTEYEFRFVNSGGRTRLEVRKFPDHRRRTRAGPPAAVVEEDARTVARALWRGLRRLQGAVAHEGFAAAWGHPFPAAIVKRLGEQLKG